MYYQVAGGTYHAVSAFASLDINAATASARIIGTGVHGVKRRCWLILINQDVGPLNSSLAKQLR